MAPSNTRWKVRASVLNLSLLGGIAVVMAIIGVNYLGAHFSKFGPNKTICHKILHWWHVSGGSLIIVGLLGRIAVERVKYHQCKKTDKI